STPSIIMAYLKLRRRNLGPILDANGWAINAKAKMNVPFGASLTAVAALPLGSARDLVDPFAEEKSPWPKVIVVIIVLIIAIAALLTLPSCITKIMPYWLLELVVGAQKWHMRFFLRN